MSKGITLSCSEKNCRQIILRYANMKGEGSFEVKCQTCGKINLVIVEQKPVIKAKLILSILIILLLATTILGSYLYGKTQQYMADLPERVQK